MKLALLLPPDGKTAIVFLTGSKETRQLLEMLDRTILCHVDDDGFYTPIQEQPFVTQHMVRCLGTHEPAFREIVDWGERQDLDEQKRKLKHLTVTAGHAAEAFQIAKNLQKQTEDDPQG